MSVQSFVFRPGEGQILKISILLNKESLDRLMMVITTDEYIKPIAENQRIDEHTLPQLRDSFAFVVQHLHECNFYPEGKKKLKNFVKDEQLSLETLLEFLKKELPSFHTIVADNITNQESKVLKKDHVFNHKKFKEMASLLGRLYAFVETNLFLTADMKNAIDMHTEDLKKICATFRTIPGLFQKGRYPSSVGYPQLAHARNMRDKWMELHPTIVMTTLKNSYSQQRGSKRSLK